MTTAKRTITRDDLIDLEAYEAERAARRKQIADIKRDRRISVGPDATFYFECYDTIWYQIQEMLRIEKGGEAQIADELSAYQTMVPNGGELVATLMFEIDDPDRRARVLGSIGGVEETVYLEFDGERLDAVAETDIDRTSAEGKASSVQFLHFPFTPDQARKFKEPGTRVTLGIGHQNYGHMAAMSEATHAALAGDLD
jgi:hypothetical protein